MGRRRGTEMLTSILRIVGVLAVVYVAVCALTWRYQDRFAFPSPRNPLPAPSALGIRDAERVTVRTADGVNLHGWYFAPASIRDQRSGGRDQGRAAWPLTPDPRPLHSGLLWFYGNMETVAALAPILAEFHPPETGMLVLDYRGYGESDSTLTEPGLYRDAEAAWDFLAARPEVDPARIAVYGRSLGSVPALYLATTRPVRAAVLDSPLSSARDMAARHYRWIPRFLVNLSLDNAERAARLQVPLLVFHGTADWIAPIAMGEKVTTAGRGELVRIEGAGHNDTYDIGAERYRDRMWAFLAGHLRHREAGSGKREE